SNNMIFRRLLAVVGTLLLSAGLASAGKDDGPKISVTEFDFEPKDLFYFEDTQTILFRDPSHRAVYRSTDAGKEWKTVDGPNGHIKGAASMIVPHPYDNRTAYILSRGQKTHWVTDDAAESWREFRIEEEVDLPLLVFHGRDPKKVILQDACTGILCEPMSYYTNDGFKSNHKFLTNAWIAYRAHQFLDSSILFNF
ncbi:vacuolar protein sorting/targeting protein PEP1, partial [Ascosphaera atra]